MAIGSASTRAIPPGISFLRYIRGRDWSPKTYQYVVLLITFIAYACYHASRKPTSIVKSVLDPELKPKELGSFPWPIGNVFVKKEFEDFDLNISSRYKGWDPFDKEDGKSRLGEIDLAFLACYSLGMYVAGHLGDTLDLRLFLTWGMIGSGLFVGLFGMGYFWNVHAFSFFLMMQMLAGVFQATGWPSVVAVIGNWFGKRRRGLIMGIWNAHTSIGNISGSLIAASMLDHGWGWSFIVPGLVMVLGGLLIFFFLAAYPEDVGFPGITRNSHRADDEEEAKAPQKDVSIETTNGGSLSQGLASRRSVGLCEAFHIPGVIPFALCLFFSKLVAYTFLYWLPFYLSETEIGHEYMSVKSAGNLSTLFDVGGIVGGVIAGYVSDKFKARATTASGFTFMAIPAMILYYSYGSISKTVNIVLMMITGLFVNGPYALITTAVSADLGTHSSLHGDSRALATVTAIIDGTGSVGAALGPFLAGFLSTKGWQPVSYMLIAGALISGLLLTRLMIDEIREKIGHGEEASASEPLLSERIDDSR